MKLVLLLAVFLIQAKLAKAQTCQEYTAPKKYQEMHDAVNESIKLLAKKKTVAAKADETLRILLKAKSPVIASWINRQDSNATEEQLALAWRDYYTENIVLSKYPQGDKKIDAEIEKTVNTLLNKYLDKKFQKRLTKLFDKTKSLAIDSLKQLLPQNNELIVERVKAIKLFFPQKLQTSSNKDNPLDLIKWGIAYDPVNNAINIGLETLYYSNDETLIAVIAHELGHSFDSCRWGAYFSGPWPFSKVGECLRTTKSVGARKRDDSQLDKMASKELVTALKLNPTCNKTSYPPQNLQADQLPESFADWFAAEVVSRLKEINLSQVRVDLCDKKISRVESSYPSNAERLERIYHANTVIAEKMKIKEATVYCSLK